MTSETPLGHERQGELDIEDLLREPDQVHMVSASPFLPQRQNSVVTDQGVAVIQNVTQGGIVPSSNLLTVSDPRLVTMPVDEKQLMVVNAEQPLTSPPAAQHNEVLPTRNIRPPILEGESCDDPLFGGGSMRHNSDLRQIPLVPVFAPTLDEFTQMSFQEYLTECEKHIDPNCGAFKVSNSLYPPS